MARQSSTALATGGITIALIIISLYTGAIIRNNRIFFVAFATYIGCIPYIRIGIKEGVITYAASALLAFIIISNKMYAGVYVFIGIYPYIKYICEGRNSKPVEYILKYIWFNVTMSIIYILFKQFIYIGSFMAKPQGIVLFIVAAEIIFFIYDMVFTKFIIYVNEKLNKIT